MPKVKCPGCKAELISRQVAGPNRPPQNGDAAVCGECTRLLIWHGRGWVIPTPALLAKAPEELQEIDRLFRRRLDIAEKLMASKNQTGFTLSDPAFVYFVAIFYAGLAAVANNMADTLSFARSSRGILDVIETLDSVRPGFKKVAHAEVDKVTATIINTYNQQVWEPFRDG